MRLFIAHNNSPHLTGINTVDWSPLSGVPSLPNTGRAVAPVLSKGALVAANQTSTPRLHIFDIHNYSVIQTHNMPSHAWALGVAPDESFVAVGHSSGNNLSFLDTSDWTLTSPSGLLPSTANGVAVHPNSDWVAVAHNNSPYFTVVSRAGENVVFAAQILSSTGNGVSFSPDGGLVAVALGTNSSSNVVVFNTATWEVEQALTLNNTAQAVQFSPDGVYLACGHNFGNGYQVFRTSDWGEEDVEGASSTGNGLSFDPTGALLVIAHNSSPFYSVRNVGTWDNAVDADFPATVASTGYGACWVPDFFGSQATTTPVATFDAEGDFSEADNVGALATSTPMMVYFSEAAVGELYEADYAAHAMVPAFDAHAQLELRATYAVVAPIQEPNFTAITGLEIEQPLPLETLLDPIRWGFGLSSTFEMDSSEAISAATSFISHMVSSSALETNLAGGMTFAEVAELSDAASISHVLLMLDTLGVTGTDDIKHIKAMLFMAAMELADDPDMQRKSTINLAAALTLNSFLAFGQQLELLSTLEVQTEFERHYNAVFNLLSSMEAVTSQTTNKHVGAVFVSTMEADATVDTQAALQMEFESLLGSYTLLKVGEDIFEGWVMNASENARGGKVAAFTNYGHYPFSSIAMFKGRPYGVADDGLYLLEGDTDQGTTIEASFKTGLLNLGQRQIKDAKALYIGYTSDGQLVLKVTTTGGGKKREDWYRLMQKEADDMRTGRVTIQRGLRATYWQFELCNVDGADFDIDDATLVYQLMTRRIRNA